MAGSSDLKQRETPAASVRRFRIDGGLLLLDQSSNSLFAFNDTARHVWDLIESGGPNDRQISEFSETWGISRELAKQDIDAIVAHWRSHGLLSGHGGLSFSRPLEETPARSDAVAQPGASVEWICTIRRIPIAIEIDGSLFGPMRDLFKHFETPGAVPQCRIEVACAAGDEIVITQDGVELLRTTETAKAAGGLYIAILERIYPGVNWFALVHGAALARAGEGLALAGPSGSGKSTLTAALMARGFDFLADDLVALSEPGQMIMPWPLPLSIKPGSVDVVSRLWPQLSQAETYRTKGMDARLLRPPPDAWDAQPVSLRRIVFPTYAAGADPELTQLTSFQAMERLLTDRMWLGSPITGERVTSFLAWLNDTPAYALTYGSLDDATRLIEDALS